MSLGGNNTFVAGDYAAQSGGSIAHTGGTGDDSLTFGGNSLEGIATFDMTAGGSNRLTAGRDAGSGGGTLTYSGGSGPDELVFGDNAALDGSFNVDLGADSVADTITFEGYVGAGGGGGVQIQNFNFNHDTIDVAAGVSATIGENTDATGDLTWTDGGGNHTIVFEDIGTGGAGVMATAAQLIAEIIGGGGPLQKL